MHLEQLISHSAREVPIRQEVVEELVLHTERFMIRVIPQSVNLVICAQHVSPKVS